MADELKLKIVLDDGSVKEGFLSVEKQAEATGKKIASNLDKKGAGFDNLKKGASEFTDVLSSAQGGVSSFASNIVSKLGAGGVVATAAAAAI